MKKALMILGIMVLLGVLVVIGTTVFANSSIDGFAEILEAGLQGFKYYLDWLTEVFKLIL